MVSTSELSAEKVGTWVAYRLLSVVMEGAVRTCRIEECWVLTASEGPQFVKRLGLRRMEALEGNWTQGNWSPPPRWWSYQWAESQAKFLESLHGWARNSWWNPNIKRECTEGGSSDRWPGRNTGILSEHAEVQLRKSKTAWNKDFCKYVRGERKSRENFGSLLNEAGDLVTQDIEKAEVLNSFFAPVFTSKSGLQESQAPEIGEQARTRKTLVEQDQGRGNVSKLDIHKSMGPDGVHLEMLRQLDDVVIGPVLKIFDRSWQPGRVPEDWRKSEVTSILKRPRTQGVTEWSASP